MWVIDGDLRSDVWNTSDGETNETAWTNQCDFGVLPVGPFPTNITGLVGNTVYYYRCWASNAALAISK